MERDAAALDRLLVSVVAALAEGRQITWIEEQLLIAAMRFGMVGDRGKLSTASVQAHAAQWILR